MKNIRKIFFSDLHSLIRNLYVLIIALGLCCLPALYAWFNIYSNWDPYGNTGNIKIAVASQDTGYTDTKGQTTNTGNSILETLKENTSIHWVFTSADKAKKGVYSGDYYAAVLLPKDFSESMYQGFMQDLKHPQLIYYENEKKNAVATKITDTAVTTLQNNINKMYISILVSNAFEKEDKIVNGAEQHDILSTLQKKVERIADNLTSYAGTITSLTNANTKLSVTIENAKTELNQIQKKLENHTTPDNDTTVEPSLLANLLPKSRAVSNSLSSVSLHINKIKSTKDVSLKTKYYKKAVSQLEKAQAQLKKITNAFQVLPSDSNLRNHYQQLLAKLEKQQTAVDSLKRQLILGINTIKNIQEGQEGNIKNKLEKTEATLQNAVSSLQNTFDNIIVPLAEEAASLADTLQKDIANSIQNIADDITLLKQVLIGCKSGLSSANESLASLSDILKQSTEGLEEINTAIRSISESEWLEQALSFIKGNPEAYGEFFSAPVKIKTERVYPVENYGSGVTPFYTTLAIWVGGIFLVSMIKTAPNRKKFPEAKPHELFWGRFLLFFLFGQLQTIIIVVGNLALLHTQCLHPKQFWLASAIASFTFLLLIYAFTVSFGDVGKAFIVVIVVIQIAGSSGTYPIEILPEFYQRIYIFFPFPYAINAMREAICGFNGNDFYIYLFQLLLFAAAALVLGLVIRLPFRRINHFVEKRMEDTGLM